MEAVAELSGQARESGVDAGYKDGDLGLLYRAGVEERAHQGVPVELALEVQTDLGLKGFPNRAQSENVLAQAGGRSRPGHREAAGYVGLYLGAEAEDEASA